MKYKYKKPHYNYHRLLNAVKLMVDLPPAASSVDLRPLMLPPRNQGQEGCCSGFSTAALREGIQSAIIGDTSKTVSLSPAYLYARTRIAEGMFPQDCGATVCDEMNTLLHFGVCPESVLPYTGLASEAPTPESDKAAAPNRIVDILQIEHWAENNITALETALARNQPVVFGTPVFESFERVGKDGLLHMPDPIHEKMLGGHAMLCVGYDRVNKLLIIRNSWGADWGDKGYCYMPYEMVVQWYEAWTARIAIPVV